MSTLREAAQQALEALKSCSGVSHWPALQPTILALRAALARQDEATGKSFLQVAPVQEPVAWSGYDLDGMVEALSRVVEAHYQRANPFQNPIYMDAQMALRILRGFIPAMKAYTAPPQRQPLTEEEIDASTAQERDALLDHIYEYGTAAEGVLERIRKLCRATEQAHGIGEQP